MPVDFAKVRSVTSTFNVHGLILILEYAVVTVDAVCPSGAFSAQSWPAYPVIGVRVSKVHGRGHGRGHRG